jgi:hypothetical protein
VAAHTATRRAETEYIDWKNPLGPNAPHEEIDISVSLEDSVYWYCDRNFRVLSVKPAPENPDAL